jgi:hypothetical protein
VLIRIWIERAQPLAGTAATVDAEPRRFDGWLELLTALSELVAAAPPVDEDQHSTEEPIEGGRIGDDG